MIAPYKIAIYGDTLVTVRFVYPLVEATKWAPVIKQMSASLRIEEDRSRHGFTGPRSSHSTNPASSDTSAPQP